MTKTNRKQTASSEYDTESRLRMVADGLSETFQSLRDGLHGEGEHPSVVADIARIATALTSTLAELRQNAKATHRALGTIPLDQIISYLKTLPDEKIHEIARELTGEGQEESLL